jgi:hypothetical protein
MWWYGVDSSGSGLGLVEGSCEHGNEHQGCIKYWGILEKVSDCWLLKKLLLSGN